MTSSKLAAIAVEADDILAALEKEAKQQQAEHGGTAPGKPKTLEEKIPQVLEPRVPQTRDKVAKLFNTNPRYVQDAKKIKEKDPQVFEQVKAGELTIPAASGPGAACRPIRR